MKYWLCLFRSGGCGPTENQTINIAPSDGGESSCKRKFGPMKCGVLTVDLKGLCKGEDMDCAFKIGSDLQSATITECEVK